ncbi:PKD-like family protein [Fodinibius roseus]|uniref:PKD-like family protein n=1 Tax=Fodinibius roseus TaxID=1194090 RepID=A0A1M5AJB5_9BACT|nr:PKD-like family lipoprotein [Fodinibius roseus]SHF30371.1 PKD-like family protein [Fodinibius roseus]
MKRESIHLLLFLTLISLGAVLSSCRDDSTTYATSEIPGVVIDTTGMPQLRLLQFEELEVAPELHTEGVGESDLSYEWRLYYAQNDTLSEVISEQRNLEGYEVELTPNEEDDPYQVQYTVTDESNGLEYIMAWPLYVMNSLGEGLVIAETDNGSDTDLSLIMAPEVTEDYSEVNIQRKVYSTINDELIPGLVQDMQPVNIYGDPVLLAITGQSVMRISRLDYSYHSMNEELFHYAPSQFSPQKLGGIYQGTVLVNNGDLYEEYLRSSRRFTAPIDAPFPFTVPAQVALDAVLYEQIPVTFYDEVNEQFIYYEAGEEMNLMPSGSGETFDPSEVTNKENMAAGVAVNGDFRHLLRDKDSGSFTLYIFNDEVSNYPDPVTPPLPKAMYDFSGAPAIEQAEYFVLPDNQRVMYYATSTTVYAALYSTSSPVFEERYTAPAGEEITSLQLYQQSGYPSDDPFIDTNHRQLVMSTYDGSEGKVYLLPITNLGVGNIDEGNIKSFGGFGRITAIKPQ